MLDTFPSQVSEISSSSSSSSSSSNSSSSSSSNFIPNIIQTMKDTIDIDDSVSAHPRSKIYRGSVWYITIVRSQFPAKTAMSLTPAYAYYGVMINPLPCR